MHTFGMLALLTTVGLFVGMLILLEIGRRFGQRREQQECEGGRAGLGTVEGAVFALMGLLVAFTFSGASSRFDFRRQQILEEANAIGTAWLRLDLMPSAAQPALRDLFRKYVDARLDVYRMLPNLEASENAVNRSNALQSEIWKQSTADFEKASPAVMGQMVPALNQMFDIANARIVAARTHPPMQIYGMLIGLSLMSSLLAGIAMSGGKGRSWIHMVGFAVIMSATVYVILDLEFPRFGFIRLDAADRALHEVRESMK